VSPIDFERGVMTAEIRTRVDSVLDALEFPITAERRFVLDTNVISPPIASRSTTMATEILEEPKTRSVLFDVRHRITVEEYHRMSDAGAFGPESRVELLEGVIVDKMTKKTPHVHATDLLDDLLHHLLPRGSGFFASMGNPVTIDDRDGEPEPDAMVLRGRLNDYAGRRRTPADLALVIEVSDTSYQIDRFVKWIMYAAARVPIYWILDLNRRRLEIHTEPVGQGETAVYTHTQILGPDDEVTLILDGREVARFAVRENLP
jgi:Uma2 family endonuclease